MKQLSKLTLASSIALALAGGMGTAFQASANAALGIDATTVPAAPTSAWDAVDQVGDTLLFPYYTVRDDARGNPLRTSFTVTNTGDKVLILKFRLRDKVNSDDVLDFMWVMSPYDEVVAYMDRTAQGIARVNFPNGENTCRIPWMNGAKSFSASLADVGASAAATQEGHLEVIPMASLDPNSTYGAYAVHQSSTGLPKDCDALDKLFGEGVSGVKTQAQLANALGSSVAPVDNVLRGAYTITAPASGFSAGASALALKDWDNAAMTSSTNSGLLFFQTPSPATPTLRDGKDAKQFYHPHLGDSSAVISAGKATASALDDGSIAARSVNNNWSVNTANGVGIDWVATFSTKYLYRLIQPTFKSDGSWATGPTYAPPFNVADDDGYLRCVYANAQIYDREENEVGGSGAVISPGPANNDKFCNEVNIISFDNGGDHEPVLRPWDEVDMQLNTETLTYPFGWAAVTAETSVPVAIDGFAFTRRSLGIQGTSFGSIVPHALTGF